MLPLSAELKRFGQSFDGPDGRIRIPRQKAQCKGSVNAHESEKFIFSLVDGTVKNFWRRSGSENIHLYLGQPRPRRRTRKSSRRIRRVFFNPTSRLTVVYDGEARNDFWSMSGNHLPSFTLNPESKCTCRGQHHVLFRGSTST